MNRGKGPAVFLDRDGVLNRALVHHGRPYPPIRGEDMEILPGVAQACERLRAAGAKLIVVTNQPDIARGGTTHHAVNAIHQVMAAALPVHEFRVCPHDDVDDCACRKPKPGMLIEAASDHDLDLGRSVMVGDRWQDVEAGARAGCSTVFVDRRYDERSPRSPDLRVGELLEAVPWILKKWRTT